MKINQQQSRETFMEIFSEKVILPGNRPKAVDVLQWLNNTTFFIDPASARQHLNVPGGLCQHSINVYEALLELVKGMKHLNCEITEEEIAITALLHDVCKIGTYELSYKNVKKHLSVNDAKSSQRRLQQDKSGFYYWEEEEYYNNVDYFPYGHGEKSVFLIQKHMDLTDREAQAIRFHMASWIESDKNYVSNAYKLNDLALMLHWADEYATYQMEE